MVNEKDDPVGTLEKMEAHRRGVLHRAFSVFIFNSEGEMLLQRRAFGKYHSGGLWTNACCSHPMPGEDLVPAARRRLQEELGFETELEKIFDFIYKASLDGGLTEHELDHVLAGIYDGPVVFNTEEVMEVKYMKMKRVRALLEKEPENFTAWFPLAFPKVEAWRRGAAP